eukprot:TRINITY_DN4391_c0_g1_i1.p1 TRINITY_DN4391_c0_g1~~TRINITY_DN4391_c0_g1_i1.p1  ORF type:complete len:331 (+),score=69.85 TRINITY_DN4391_c0_g1_i1:157-1149(+)
MTAPVIDLQKFLTGSSHVRRAIGQQLDHVFQHGAAFKLTSHSVPTSLIHSIRRSTRDFFSQPLSYKSQFQTGEGMPRGYDNTPTSLSYHKTLENPTLTFPPDLRETFTMGPEYSDHVRAQHGELFTPFALAYGQNKYPSIPASLKTEWLDYFHHMERVSGGVFQMVGAALGVTDPDFFAQRTKFHASLLRSIFYPAQKEDPMPEQLRCGEHCDWVPFTILQYEQVKTGGLEVKQENGRWEPVTLQDDELLVHLGDMMAHWTRGRYRAPMHRVANPLPEDRAGNSRLTFAYFCIPTVTTTLDGLVPIPEGQTVTTAGQHLFDRYNRVYARK